MCDCSKGIKGIKSVTLLYFIVFYCIFDNYKYHMVFLL